MKKYEVLYGDEIDLKLNKFVDAVPEKKWVPKFVFDVVLHGTNIVVGKCEARIGESDNLFFNGHIGYSTIDEYRGRGLAGKSVELLYGIFEDHNINKVYISNDPRNYASRRVCEKLGLEYLGEYDLPEDNAMRLEQGKTRVNVFLKKL
jgi:RimJ/RimL family protein N-acetyltransferase